MPTGDIAAAGPSQAAASTPAQIATAATAATEAALGRAALLGGLPMNTPDLSRFGPEAAAYIAARPALLDAVAFRSEFRPDPETDYDWLLEYAKDRFEETVGIYNALDAKAATVLTHLGSGTGLLTLGTVAAVSSGSVTAVVGLTAVVPFLVASAALWFAVRARRSFPHVWPPSAREQVRHATQSKTAKVETIADFDQTTEYLSHRAADRSRSLNHALRLMAYAVFALAAPLAVAVAEKWPR